MRTAGNQWAVSYAAPAGSSSSLWVSGACHLSRLASLQVGPANRAPRAPTCPPPVPPPGGGPSCRLLYIRLLPLSLLRRLRMRNGEPKGEVRNQVPCVPRGHGALGALWSAGLGPRPPARPACPVVIGEAGCADRKLKDCPATGGVVTRLEMALPAGFGAEGRLWASLRRGGNFS